MNWKGETAVVCVVVFLLELVLHWLPWRMALGRDLHRVTAYVLGVLGIAVPVGVLLLHWWRLYEVSYPLPVSEMVLPQLVLARVMWMELCVIVAAGVAVMAGYGLDWLLVRVRQSYELRELLDGRQVD